MRAESAHVTTASDSDRSELHVENIDSFGDLGLNLPFEYGDAIHDLKRGIAHTPKAIAPAENDGFRVYVHTSEVSERRGDALKITDAGTPGSNSIPMKLLLTILDEDTTEIVDADRITA